MDHGHYLKFGQYNLEDAEEIVRVTYWDDIFTWKSWEEMGSS